MLVQKLKVAVGVLALAAALALGVCQLTPAAPPKVPLPAAARPKPQEKKAPAATQDALTKPFETVRWYLMEVNLEKDTIDISDTALAQVGTGPHGAFTLKSLPFAKEVKIRLDGKEAQFSSLRMGMPVKVRFSEGKLVVAAIEAVTLRVGYAVKAVNAAKGTLTVAFGPDGATQELAVPEGTYIYLHHKGNPGKLADLEPGLWVSLQIEVSDGRLIVRDIRARK